MMSKKPTNSHRYNVTLPEKVYSELKKIAEDHDESVLEFIRKSIKLGILVARLDKEEGALIIRQGETEKQVIFL